MNEIWKLIDEVPKYEVSNMGRVRRLGAILPLAPKTAKGGTLFVTMSYNGERYSRSVKVLVAKAFVPKPVTQSKDIFDTPIIRTITTDNPRADLIVWRPLWFAIQYRRQLHPATYPLYWDIPVINIDTGNEHASVLTAAIHDGVLMKDIYKSAGEGWIVFPNGHRYDFIHRLEDGFGSVHQNG